MIERIFSNLVFVKLQNLFPRNSCIPFKTIKTMQINFIFACFCSVAGSAVSQHVRSSVPPFGGEAIKGAPQYFFVLETQKLLSKSSLKSTLIAITSCKLGHKFSKNAKVGGASPEEILDMFLEIMHLMSQKSAKLPKCL